MSDFWIASFFTFFFNAGSAVLWDSMSRKWFYRSRVTAISQTLKISLNIWWKRETVCALPWGKVKPFHSWLLFGLPNVSPFSCLGDFFAHLSSQVVLPLHLFPLPPLFAEWWHKHRPSFRGHRWLYGESDGKLSYKNLHFSAYIYMRIRSQQSGFWSEHITSWALWWLILFALGWRKYYQYWRKI